MLFLARAQMREAAWTTLRLTFAAIFAARLPRLQLLAALLGHPTMRADNEKRRATSREAARRRRRVETDMFGDLSHLLPLHPSARRSLDKPSIIRLTLSYIRAHALLKDVNAVKLRAAMRAGALQNTAGPREEEEEEVQEETSLFLSVLEGFLMVLSTEGDVVFLSENVGQHLGLVQTELMGHNIFEFTHPGDHEDIRTHLCLTAEEVRCSAERNFVLRVKSSPTSRGRTANLKSATWKVLLCRGRAKMSAASCLLLTCQPLPLTHTLLSTHTFTSQHSMDMRFTHCDHRVKLLLGYQPEELLGCSLYQLCHCLDAGALAQNHLNLCLRSLSVSAPYRILVKSGGFVWVETHSAVVPSVEALRSRPAAPPQLRVLSVTYILSGVEEPSLQLSLHQDVHARSK